MVRSRLNKTRQKGDAKGIGFDGPRKSPLSALDDSLSKQKKLLILVRLRGSVVLWGLDAREVVKLGSFGECTFTKLKAQLQLVHTTDDFMKVMQKECGRHRLTRGESTRGLCERMSLEVFEVQPYQMAGKAVTVARRCIGALKVSTILKYEEIFFDLHGRLLPTCGPFDVKLTGSRADALNGKVTLGGRATTQEEKRSWRHRMEVLPRPGGMANYCCSACLSKWALETLQLTAEIRREVT